MSSLAIADPPVDLDTDPEDVLRMAMNPITGETMLVDGSIADSEIDWSLGKREALEEYKAIEASRREAPSEIIDLLSALVSGSVFIPDEPVIEVAMDEVETDVYIDTEKHADKNDVYADFDKRYYKIKSPSCIYDLTKNLPLAHAHVRQYYSSSTEHHKKNPEGGKPYNLYSLWFLDSPNNADGIDFRPDLKPYSIFKEHDDKTGLDNKIFNIFSGFIDPDPSGNCQLFLNFVREVIAMDCESYYIWLLNWMARIVQDPCDRIHSYALALQSAQGYGKTFFFDSFGHLLRNAYAKIDDMENLLGFNSLICGRVLCYLEEAIYTASQRESNRLKNIINGNTIDINQKHIAQFTIKNYLTIGSGTNADVSAPVELGDRRWVCLQLSGKHKEDHAYFHAIQDQLEHGGYGALMHYLKNYKLDYSILDDRPVTTLHRENQKAWLYKNKPIYAFLKKLLDEYNAGATGNLLSEIDTNKDDPNKGRSNGWIKAGIFNAQYADFLSRNHEHRGVDARCVVPMLREILKKEKVSDRHYFNDGSRQRAYQIGTIEELDATINMGEDDEPQF